jgi:choline dehydrogenase-like flavoprotein
MPRSGGGANEENGAFPRTASLVCGIFGKPAGVMAIARGPRSTEERRVSILILDANSGERALFERTFDVCIVGSGPAGISTARKLAAKGFDVALMEGGGLEISAESQELYEGDIIGLDYYDPTTTRLRYFGGTSNHWGGRSRPLDAYDFEARLYHPLSGWPITIADVEPYIAETDEILDLSPASTLPDQPVEGAAADLKTVRFRMSPPTRFNGKYHDELAASERIRLVLNANMVDLRLNEAGTAVTGAIFRSYDPEDSGFTVRARIFCLCLGGMETPRALLNANSQMPAGIGNRNDLVGRYFSEHPTYNVGQILFENGVPPTTGYSPTPALMEREEILNFDTLMVTKGMDFATEAKRSVACSTDFMQSLAERVLGRPFNCSIGGLQEYFELRGTQDYRTGQIGSIIEQALNPDSRVILTDETDRFGLRHLALDWQLSPLDYRTLRGSVTVLGQYFAQARIGRVQVAEWLQEEDPTPPELGSPGSEVALHHHMCTTRMSADPAHGVVDADCRVHGIDNLYIGGCSVFATGGHANPTYTIVQLSLRLGDHLSNVLAG